jgi:hypothetical protein
MGVSVRAAPLPNHTTGCRHGFVPRRRNSGKKTLIDPSIQTVDGGMFSHSKQPTTIHLVAELPHCVQEGPKVAAGSLYEDVTDTDKNGGSIFVWADGRGLPKQPVTDHILQEQFHPVHHLDRYPRNVHNVHRISHRGAPAGIEPTSTPQCGDQRPRGHTQRQCPQSLK